jgi:hypothetical protein
MSDTQQESAPLARPAGPEPGPRPRLGHLGAAASLLFPAAAPSQPRSRGRATLVALAYLIAAVVGAGVLLVRQAGTPSWATTWSEDRWVFLPRAFAHPWSSLIHEYAGYLQLTPQLIADVVAQLPLRFAAAGFAIAGALVASSCAVFVFQASSGQLRVTWLRVLLAGSVLLLPTALIEVANSGVDSPWYLMFALFWALLWRPRSRRGRALAAVIGFLTMASNILNLLWLPLVAARVIALPRVREHAVTAGWAAGVAFQVFALTQAREPHRIGPVPSAFSFYGQHVLVPAVAGWRLALRLEPAVSTPACVAAAALVVAAMVTWAVRRGGPRVGALALAAIGMGLILTIIPALLRYWVPGAVSTDVWVPGARFTTEGILLIDVVAIAGADAVLRRPVAELRHFRSVAVVAVLLAVLAVGWSTSFRYPNLRSGNPPWSQTYMRYRRTLPALMKQPVVANAASLHPQVQQQNPGPLPTPGRPAAEPCPPASCCPPQPGSWPAPRPRQAPSASSLRSPTRPAPQ